MWPWRFLLGPGLLPRLNALFLGYVMDRSRLVPRLIPAIGLVGAPLILASAHRHPLRRLGRFQMGAA
jgi:Domain of unknown function (DUF4386)